MKYHQGTYKIKNKNKYHGNSSNITFRSNWEFVFMRFLDHHPDVIKWASEELIIPYKSPLDGKYHRYFTDFWVKKKNKQGDIDTVVIEIKPMKQTKEPKPQKRMTKRYIHEVKSWCINTAKWNAAKKYCDEKGWDFIIMTEKELGL